MKTVLYLFATTVLLFGLPNFNSNGVLYLGAISSYILSLKPKGK